VTKHHQNVQRVPQYAGACMMSDETFRIIMYNTVLQYRPPGRQWPAP